MKITQVHLTFCGPHGLYSPWNPPGQNTGVDSLSLLQGIFLTQGSNPGLLHCRRILNHLSHQGSPVEIRAALQIRRTRSPTSSPGVWTECLQSAPVPEVSDSRGVRGKGRLGDPVL